MKNPTGLGWLIVPAADLMGAKRLPWWPGERPEGAAVKLWGAK